ERLSVLVFFTPETRFLFCHLPVLGGRRGQGGTTGSWACFFFNGLLLLHERPLQRPCWNIVPLVACWKCAAVGWIDQTARFASVHGRRALPKRQRREQTALFLLIGRSDYSFRTWCPSLPPSLPPGGVLAGTETVRRLCCVRDYY
ncbi:unnamed protein product, partial [Laminaria digitata]